MEHAARPRDSVADYLTGSALEGMGLDVFNNGTIEGYRNLLAGRRHPWARSSKEDLLFQLNAVERGIDGELHPTMAGLLAFGDEFQIVHQFPTYHLDYRAEGSDGRRWRDRLSSMSGDWSGNLLDFYALVTQRLDRELPRPFALEDGGWRHGSGGALNDAAHEAVANALVHAYYGGLSQVSVLFQADKLVVSNSGTFLVDPDVAIAGGTTEARNPTLVRIFGIVGIIDRAGSGLKTLYDTWNAYFGEFPTIEESYRPDEVTLELPLNVSGLAASGRSAGQMQETNDRHREKGRSYTVVPHRDILAFCADQGGITAKELAERFAMKRNTAQKVLRGLVDSGELVRELVGREYVYERSREPAAGSPSELPAAKGADPAVGKFSKQLWEDEARLSDYFRPSLRCQRVFGLLTG